MYPYCYNINVLSTPTTCTVLAIMINHKNISEDVLFSSSVDTNKMVRTTHSIKLCKVYASDGRATPIMVFIISGHAVTWTSNLLTPKLISSWISQDALAAKFGGNPLKHTTENIIPWAPPAGSGQSHINYIIIQSTYISPDTSFADGLI